MKTNYNVLHLYDLYLPSHWPLLQVDMWLKAHQYYYWDFSDDENCLHVYKEN